MEKYPSTELRTPRSYSPKAVGVDAGIDAAGGIDGAASRSIICALLNSLPISTARFTPAASRGEKPARKYPLAAPMNAARLSFVGSMLAALSKLV